MTHRNLRNPGLLLTQALSCQPKQSIGLETPGAATAFIEGLAHYSGPQPLNEKRI